MPLSRYRKTESFLGNLIIGSSGGLEGGYHARLVEKMTLTWPLRSRYGNLPSLGSL
jgi:hypothetical protein